MSDHDWKKVLELQVTERMQKGGFERGTLKTFIQEFATKEDIPFNTVNGEYYRILRAIERGDIDMSKSDDMLAKSLRTRYNRPTKPPYKVGERVTVVITEIHNYGAFVYTDDGWEYKGLIHKSKVNSLGYVDDIRRHFMEGDRVEAELVAVKADGSLEFSTKNTSIPDYWNGATGSTTVHSDGGGKLQTLGDKLAGLKDQIVTVELPANWKPEGRVELVTKQELSKASAEVAAGSSTQVVVTAPSNPTNKEEEPKVSASPTELITEVSEKHAPIVKYLTNKLGALSPKALEKLVTMMENTNDFEFGMKVAVVEQSFDVDLGLLFLQEVEKQMGNRL